MIYAEFIDRDRTMPLEVFRMFADQSSWTSPEDGMVGNLARTMRMGPMPGWIAFWQCRGLARMDEWEDHFRSPDGLADLPEQATLRAIHLVRGGCYDELYEGPAIDRDGLVCIEYFPAPEAAEGERIAETFRERAARHPEADLNFVLRRIGRLGPNPGSLAVWSFADYAAIEPFQRAPLDDDPYRPEETGLYRWVGREVL